MIRDHWVCQICLLLIPSSAKMGELLYGNVDHIVPVSKGGSQRDTNLQATHYLCNSVKRNQEDADFKDRMREILQDIVNSIER